MYLEQNLFAPDSRGARRTPPDSRWRGSFPQGGYRLGTVRVGGTPVTPVVDDTRMRLDLPTPVAAAGGRVEVTMDYAFVVPEYGADRMGRFPAAQGTVYEIAQWYPRVAVYDDVSGWNTLPYLGQGEFYLGYGDFDYEITVPAEMTVVGTGTLVNEDDVFTREQRERIARARRSTSRVRIVEPGEVGTPAASAARSGLTTWKFRAENVRDVAWAASTSFIYDGANAAIRQDDGSVHDVFYPERLPRRRALRRRRQPRLGGGDALRPRGDHQQQPLVPLPLPRRDLRRRRRRRHGVPDVPVLGRRPHAARASSASSTTSSATTGFR